MVDYNIRDISPEEVSELYPRLNELSETYYSSPLSLEDYIDSAENNFLIGAFEGKLLVGHAAGTILKPGTYSDVLHSKKEIFRPRELVVEKDHRKNGLGKSLLLSLNKKSLEYECNTSYKSHPEMRFRVNLSRPNLVKFYTDLGLSVCTFNPNKTQWGVVYCEDKLYEKPSIEPANLNEYVNNRIGKVHFSEKFSSFSLKKEHDFLLKVDPDTEKFSKTLRKVMLKDWYVLTDVFKSSDNGEKEWYYRFQSYENILAKKMLLIWAFEIEDKKWFLNPIRWKQGALNKFYVGLKKAEIKDLKNSMERAYKIMPQLNYLKRKIKNSSYEEKKELSSYYDYGMGHPNKSLVEFCKTLNEHPNIEIEKELAESVEEFTGSVGKKHKELKEFYSKFLSLYKRNAEFEFLERDLKEIDFERIKEDLALTMVGEGVEELNSGKNHIVDAVSNSLPSIPIVC